MGKTKAITAQVFLQIRSGSNTLVTPREGSVLVAQGRLLRKDIPVIPQCSAPSPSLTALSCVIFVLNSPQSSSHPVSPAAP